MRIAVCGRSNHTAAAAARDSHLTQWRHIVQYPKRCAPNVSKPPNHSRATTKSRTEVTGRLSCRGLPIVSIIERNIDRGALFRARIKHPFSNRIFPPRNLGNCPQVSHFGVALPGFCQSRACDRDRLDSRRGDACPLRHTPFPRRNAKLQCASTLLHGVSSGGVTFSQVFPSSCVS